MKFYKILMIISVFNINNTNSSQVTNQIINNETNNILKSYQNNSIFSNNSEDLSRVVNIPRSSNASYNSQYYKNLNKNNSSFVEHILNQINEYNIIMENSIQSIGCSVLDILYLLSYVPPKNDIQKLLDYFSDII